MFKIRLETRNLKTQHVNSIVIWVVYLLTELLNKYRKCFAFNLKVLGCTDLFEMDFVDIGHPTVSEPYRCSAAERDVTVET